MRLSLSSASGPGLYLTSATLRSGESLPEIFGFCCLFLSFISLCSIGVPSPGAGRTESLRSPVGVFGSRRASLSFLPVPVSGRTPVSRLSASVHKSGSSPYRESPVTPSLISPERVLRFGRARAGL